MTPSFFTEHNCYFGDTHVKIRVEKQAFFESPMRAAIDKGLRPTNHTDFVVAPLDQVFVMWTAKVRTLITTNWNRTAAHLLLAGLATVFLSRLVALHGRMTRSQVATWLTTRL
jgi:hypothetical protein